MEIRKEEEGILSNVDQYGLSSDDPNFTYFSDRSIVILSPRSPEISLTIGRCGVDSNHLNIQRAKNRTAK